MYLYLLNHIGKNSEMGKRRGKSPPQVYPDFQRHLADLPYLQRIQMPCLYKHLFQPYSNFLLMPPDFFEEWCLPVPLVD